MYAVVASKVTIDTTDDPAKNIMEGSATKAIGNMSPGRLLVDKLLHWCLVLFALLWFVVSVCSLLVYKIWSNIADVLFF